LALAIVLDAVENEQKQWRPLKSKPESGVVQQVANLL